jgi:hypothetical protein
MTRAQSMATSSRRLYWRERGLPAGEQPEQPLSSAHYFYTLIS